MVALSCFLRRLKKIPKIVSSFPKEVGLAVLFSYFLLAVIVTAHDGGGEECVIVFENEDMRVRAREECNKTNPLDVDKMVENYPINATFEAFEFDDNCFTNCVYKAENIILEDGTLNRDEVQHFFKSNMSSALYTKLTSLFYACIDTTNKIATKKSLDPCKKASLHEYCVVKGIITSHDLLQMDC